eukprot:625387-Prorocentrum_lima.AAC.1
MACRIEVVSPATQMVSMPLSCRDAGPLHLMCKAIEEPAPSLTIAAQAAFWSLPKRFLDDVVKLHGLPIRDGKTLFSLLFGMASNILQTDEAATMKILSKRLAAQDLALSYLPDFCRLILPLRAWT